MNVEKPGLFSGFLSIDLKNVDWIRELLYLNLAAMEACLVYPWYWLFNSLTENQDYALPIWAICVLFWAPYLLAELLNRSQLTADIKQAVIAASMIFAVLFVVRTAVYADVAFGDLSWFLSMIDRLFTTLSTLAPEFVIIILILVAWWRGIVLNRKDYDTRKTGLHFRVSIIILLVYFIVSIFTPRQDMTGSVLTFFFFALLTIALARVLQVGGIHSSSLGSKQWVGILVGSSLGAIMLAVLLSMFFSRQVVRTLVDHFLPFWRFWGRVLWYALGALLYLFYPLVQWLLDLYGQLEQNRGVGGEQIFNMSPLENPLLGQEAEEFQHWYGTCNTVFMVIIVALGLLFVARLIRQITRTQEADQDIERISVWSLRDWAEDLRRALRNGLDNLAAFAGQFGDRKKRSAASIRKIYASMVDLAAESGYPRLPAVTPYEHSVTLYDAFPQAQDAVDTITEAYVRVHYGEVPETKEEMQLIVNAWERLQASMTQDVEIQPFQGNVSDKDSVSRE